MLTVSFVRKEFNQIFLVYEFSLLFQYRVTKSSQPLIKNRMICYNQVLSNDQVPQFFKVVDLESKSPCSDEVSDELYALFNLFRMGESVKYCLFAKLFDIIRRHLANLRLNVNHVLIEISENVFKQGKVFLNKINASLV